MLRVRTTKKFDRDYKKVIKRGLSDKKLKKVVEILIRQEKLPSKYRDHALKNSRNYKNLRECHIQPDWLLVYEIDNDNLILLLFRTGSHSDLFDE